MVTRNFKGWLIGMMLGAGCITCLGESSIAGPPSEELPSKSGTEDKALHPSPHRGNVLHAGPSKKSKSRSKSSRTTKAGNTQPRGNVAQGNPAQNQLPRMNLPLANPGQIQPFQGNIAGFQPAMGNFNGAMAFNNGFQNPWFFPQQPFVSPFGFRTPVYGPYLGRPIMRIPPTNNRNRHAFFYPIYSVTRQVNPGIGPGASGSGPSFGGGSFPSGGAFGGGGGFRGGR